MSYYDSRVEPATEKQISFLTKLVTDLADIRSSVEGTAFNRDGFIAAGAEAIPGLNKTTASVAIDTVLTKIKTIRAANPTAGNGIAKLPDVPAGRYAVDNDDGILRFYRVDRPTEGKWAGMTFVKVYASDETYPVKGESRKTVLTKIAADPTAAMTRFGQEIGKCGRCGRTLTDPVSRDYGIGPDCREIMGLA